VSGIPYLDTVLISSIRHKYTLFLSVDGNFRLQRKDKKSDPDDIALNDGHGYFVKSDDFNSYLGVVKPSDDVRSSFHFIH